MKTIAQRWGEFSAATMPKGAPDIQVREMRRAFYAGFVSALGSTLEASVECGDNDDIGATKLEQLWAECKAFNRAVAEGRA